MIEENRESFFNRIEPFFPPSILLDVNLAYTLAKYGHRAQVRKELDAQGDPIRYFEHVRRVAIVLIDEAKIVKSEMVIAALLHDGIEDTKDLTPAMIEHCFGTDVVSIVKTLSKVPNEGYIERFLMSSDWRSYMIKACDRLDNLRSLNAAPVDFQRKQIAETRGKYYQLFDRMIDIIPPEHKKQAHLMRDQIIMTTEKHATLMETK